MNILLGVLEDNLILIYFGKYLKLYGLDFVDKITTPYSVIFDIEKGTEYPFFALYFTLARYVEAFTLYNLFIVISILLTCIFYYKFISYFLQSKIIKAFLTLMFVISPYFSYQYRSHPTLMFVWLLLLCMSVVVKPISRKTLLFSLSAAVLSSFSNYLAYFALIFYSLYTTTHVIIDFINKRNLSSSSIKRIKYFIINILIFIVFALFAFGPKLFTANNNDPNEFVIPVRTLEDFFTFTSRPWYYLLPSVDNPFYGSYSQSVINFLQNEWGYFLTSNYFKSEHSASFMGLINILIGIIGVISIIRINNKDTSKPILLTLFITGILIALLTMPPFITVGGFRFYMPSYIAYLIFPMFRVLVRLGVVNIALLLIFTGIGYEYLIEHLRKCKVHVQRLGYALIVFLGLLSLSELWVPIQITAKGEVPEVFKDLATYPNDGSILIYPENMSYYSLIWHETHKKPAFYLRARLKVPQDIDTKEVVDNVVSEKGIEQAKKYGVKYIVVFNNNNVSFFDTSPKLKKIGTYAKSPDLKLMSNNTDWLVNIINIGPTEAADLYLIK